MKKIFQCLTSRSRVSHRIGFNNGLTLSEEAPLVAEMITMHGSVAGGSPLIMYPKKIEELSIDEKRNYMLANGATFGTMSVCHTIKDGPWKGRTVVVAGNDVVKDDSNLYYVWKGHCCYLSNMDGSQHKVKLWSPIEANALARDKTNDVALLQVSESCLDGFEIDTIHEFGKVKVSPEDIGQVYRLDQGDAFLVNGVRSSVHAYFFNQQLVIKNSNCGHGQRFDIEFVHCHRHGERMERGDCGAPFVTVPASDDDEAVLISILAHGDCDTETGIAVERGPSISSIQKLMRYPCPTRIESDFFRGMANDIRAISGGQCPRIIGVDIECIDDSKTEIFLDSDFPTSGPTKTHTKEGLIYGLDMACVHPNETIFIDQI